MAQIKVGRSVYGRNDEQAEANRRRFRASGVLAVNLLSSPGAGKTCLLERTALAMKDDTHILVVDGDVETERDADRLRARGIEAIQIQTHGACHLDARRVAAALEGKSLDGYELLLIENIGNLVCPSNFDLGEDLRIVVASTTEGDDKPLKYPEAYHTADACVLNKVDLLPHVAFSVEAFEAAARRTNDRLRLFRTSCTSGEGIPEWCQWLRELLVGRRQGA